MSVKNEGLPQLFERPADKVHLTEAGEKLLEVLKVPELRIQSVTNICEHAGISRDSYYRLFKSPDFIQQYSELCKNVLLSFAMPASQALGRQASTGDTQAIRMILEMAGIYSPSAQVTVNHTVDAKPTLKEILARKKKESEKQEVTPCLPD